MVAHIIARSIGRRIGKKLLEEQQAVDFWRRELTFSQQEELDRRLKEEGKSVLVAYLRFCTLPPSNVTMPTSVDGGCRLPIT